MNRPKNHHYIPQMLLKRFTNQEGKLYVYDRCHPEKGIQKKDPKKTFVRRHLYTQVKEDGTRDVEVETKFLAPLESDVSPVIEKIVNAARRGNPPNLTPDEKGIWIRFFYSIFARVPDTLNPATDIVRHMILAEIQLARQSRPLNDLEQAVLDSPETMERHLTNGRIQHLQMSLSSEVSELLTNTRIAAAVIRKMKPVRSFVIGSNPVVKLTYPGRSHLADPTVEVWLPLARDVTVSPCPGESDKVISVKGRHIESINRSLFMQSTVIAGCSQELVESIAGRHLEHNPVRKGHAT